MNTDKQVDLLRNMAAKLWEQGSHCESMDLSDIASNMAELALAVGQHEKRIKECCDIQNRMALKMDTLRGQLIDAGVTPRQCSCSNLSQHKLVIS